MYKCSRIFFLLVFTLVFSFNLVWGQETKADYSKEVELFIQVVSFGETKKDPFIMISAVRMMDTLAIDSITNEKTGIRYERGQLLTKAQEYASGDKEILEIISKIQNEKTAVRGYRRSYHHVPPHAHCFIATAAYGSSLSEEVSILQAFRDRFLLSNIPGKILVKVYYTFSPPLADLIAQDDTLRMVTRGALYPVVGVARYVLKSPFAFSLLGIGFLLLFGLMVLDRRIHTGPQRK